MSEESKEIQLQPDWEVLRKKAQERALQFMNDPDLDQYAKEYIIGSLSENTLRAYASDVKIFRLWCESRDFKPLPATPNVIANFLAAQAQSKDPVLKAVTLSRRLAAIRYVHKMAGLHALPTDDVLVRQTLRGIMRKKLTAPNKKAPTTNDLIHAMVEQIDTTTLLGLRDRALILLGFSGAFRRSELIRIKLEELNVHEKGMDVFLPSSKTDQTGKGFTKAIVRGETHCPVEAVQEWIAASNIESGYLIRGFYPKSSKMRPALNDPDKPEVADILVARIVKKYASLIGLNEDDFSGHSLRSGFITAARNNGATYEKIMEVTGQKDLKTLMRYYQNLEKYDGHAGEGLL